MGKKKKEIIIYEFMNNLSRKGMRIRQSVMAG